MTKCSSFYGLVAALKRKSGTCWARRLGIVKHHVDQEHARTQLLTGMFCTSSGVSRVLGKGNILSRTRTLTMLDYE